MKLDTRSIRFRMWIYFALFTLFIMALLWVFQVVLFRPYYEGRRVRDIQTVAAAIHSAYEKPEFIDTIDRMAFRHHVSVTIIDRNSEISYSINMLGPGSPFGYSRDVRMPTLRTAIQYSRFFPEIVEKGEILVKLRNPLMGNSTLLYGGMMYDSQGNPASVLFLNASIDPLETTLVILREQLIIVTVGVVILSMLLSLLLSSRISGPIVRIAGESRKLARQDFDVKFERSRYSEINQLAEALQNAARDLSQVEGLRRELISNISHDLRTPLTMIKGYAEMVREISGDNPEKRDRDIQVIIEETQRLNHLVDDILCLSKIQSGAEKINREVFNLTDTLRQTLKRYRLFSEKHGISISLEARKEVLVEADRKKITQVMENLLNNAIRHGGKTKPVEVRQIVVSNLVRIEVADGGPGIPPELLNRIWERYYRTPDPFQADCPGTGLGLSIVKSILNLHDARYGVYSGEGLGSTFWFELQFHSSSAG